MNVRNRAVKIIAAVAAAVIICVTGLTGCGGASTAAAGGSDAPDISGLTYSSTMKLDYAKCFDVYYYKGGYALIDVHNDTEYLVIPKGKKKPAKLDKDIVVIKKPVKNIYLAATSTMALFNSMGALDRIRLTELKASGWFVPAAKKAMQDGRIIYAGKYSAPDYEKLLDEKCGLAIESTMIYHSPDVKDMIEDIGIPVFVDRSSYETHPLGRAEWIKLYGVLTDREDAAVKFFDKQKKVVEKLKNFKNTGKTVAFFYVSTDGKAVVRSSSDYIPTMIKIAGGKYIFSDLKNKNGKTSVPMSMEKFYDEAKNADYIVYNGSIDSTVRSVADLKAKDDIFAGFKAVKNNNCWVTGSSLYQRTDIVGSLIQDFHNLLTEKNPHNLKYIRKLE